MMEQIKEALARAIPEALDGARALVEAENPEGFTVVSARGSRIVSPSPRRWWQWWKPRETR